MLQCLQRKKKWRFALKFCAIILCLKCVLNHKECGFVYIREIIKNLAALSHFSSSLKREHLEEPLIARFVRKRSSSTFAKPFAWWADQTWGHILSGIWLNYCIMEALLPSFDEVKPIILLFFPSYCIAAVILTHWTWVSRHISQSNLLFLFQLEETGTYRMKVLLASIGRSWYCMEIFENSYVHPWGLSYQSLCPASLLVRLLS